MQNASVKARPPLRWAVAQILDVNGDHRLSQLVDITLIVLISINVAAVIMESVSEFGARHQTVLLYIEIFSVSVFSIEYILRVWACLDFVNEEGQPRFSSRTGYFFSPMALIDLAAIAPFYLAMLFSIDLRFLRVVRLLRIFKLTRYSSAIGLVLDVFRYEARSFVAAFSVLMVILILASSGIYLLEHKLQPENFGSIPDAMWWAMSSLTTVGYGDSVPITPLGKIFGGFITIIGMGMVALPAGILASGFADQISKRRALYEDKLSEALQDGEISADEEATLKRLQADLGLSHAHVEKLTHRYLKRLYQGTANCPHCGVTLSMGALVQADRGEGGPAP